jgi:hypothetical protein
MLFTPVASAEPLTVKAAVPLPPDAVSVAVPSAVLPTVSATLPPGAAAPLAGFTVTVSTVLALIARLAGFGDTAVVVATGAVRVTVAFPLELRKVPDPA